MFKFIRSHFEKLSRRSKFGFYWRAWVEATLIAYAVANLIQVLFHFRDRTDLDGKAPFALLFLVVVVGPLIETLIFQSIPLEFASSLKMRRVARLMLSVIPFALAHCFAGVPTVISAGLVGGFYFAFTYSRWRDESLLAAILMTFLLHSSFNLVGAIGLLIMRR